jgi:small-conductance mechanosensitive channel
MKLTKHAWIIWGISLAVVLVLMVAIPFARTAAWWIGAACMVAMFGLCAFTFHLAFRKGENTESKLLGWPIFKVGYVALIAQVIVGGILMGIASFCPAWSAVIAEVLVFAVTGVCLTLKEASRTVVTQAESNVQEKTLVWKSIRAKANALAASSGNADMKKLAEEIRFADPMPTEVDGEIAEMLEKMTGDVNEGDVEKVMQMVRGRKELGKGNK